MGGGRLVATALIGRGGDGRGERRRSAVVIVVLGALLVAGALTAGGVMPAAGASGDLRVLMGAPDTLDPAAAGEHTSASVIAQLQESLTAVDPALNVQPALAASWDVEDGGKRLVFHLRDGLTFSDGSPLRAADVVRSWLRVIDPRTPSPLASLMGDVRGAADYLRGRSTDPASVGLRATGSDVEVELLHPSDFAAVVAGPTFAVVPDGLVADPRAAAGRFVGSGAYVLAEVAADALVLRANPHYWAGPPPIATVRLVSDLGGRTIIDAYEHGDLDYTPVPAYDADWIRYDERLGADLRFSTDPTVDYLSFDTTKPPFDDVRVRQAFGAAVDWRRIVTLGGGEATPATGLVPPAIPGGSTTDFLPRHDPNGARALLAAAGFPNGAGFPNVTFVSTGDPYAEAILTELRRELGVTVSYEAMDYGTFAARLAEDPPGMWTLGWVADYPGANDFLGVLLGTGESNNNGRWSSAEFDRAVADALAASDAGTATRAFERAQSVVQRDVPVVPLSYRAGWWLARPGLLGAVPGGLAIPRLAGFAWGPGS